MCSLIAKMDSRQPFYIMFLTQQFTVERATAFIGLEHVVHQLPFLVSRWFITSYSHEAGSSCCKWKNNKNLQYRFLGRIMSEKQSHHHHHHHYHHQYYYNMDEWYVLDSWNLIKHFIRSSPPKHSEILSVSKQPLPLSLKLALPKPALEVFFHTICVNLSVAGVSDLAFQLNFLLSSYHRFVARTPVRGETCTQEKKEKSC